MRAKSEEGAEDEVMFGQRIAFPAKAPFLGGETAGFSWQHLI
jgi:hypothetical protein